MDSPVLASPRPASTDPPSTRARRGLLAWRARLWSALLHLLVYGFGWSCPDRGLRWWYDDGRSVDDPKLALLSEIWDADGQLDWFAAWLWTSGGRIYLVGLGRQEHPSTWTIDGSPTSSTGSAITRARSLRRWIRPTSSGAHIDGPLQRTRAGPQLTVDPSGKRRASLDVESMTGWYSALTDGRRAACSEGAPSWKVDLIVRPVGWLGTFRRSRATGLWFSGRHRYHLAGTGTYPLTRPQLTRRTAAHEPHINERPAGRAIVGELERNRIGNGLAGQVADARGTV